MTDERFNFLLSIATEDDLRECQRVLRWYVWKLKHPRLSYWLESLASAFN